jgi:predicted aspartyl protease
VEVLEAQDRVGDQAEQEVLEDQVEVQEVQIHRQRAVALVILLQLVHLKVIQVAQVHKLLVLVDQVVEQLWQELNLLEVLQIQVVLVLQLV